MSRNQEEFRLACVVANQILPLCRANVEWYHIPNGENRSEATGARLKRMGVKRGVADYVFHFLPCPFCRSPVTAYLELKRPGGQLRPEQKAFKDRVVALGCRYAVARTGQEAIEILSSWGILERVKVAA